MGKLTFKAFKSIADVPNIAMSKGKRRHAMPQINSADVDEFNTWGQENKYFDKPKAVTLNTKDLIPTQAEFNKSKIVGMAQTGNYKNKRIMVSVDNRVIDGHHTWLAADRVEGTVKAIRYSLNAEDLLKIMKVFPKSFTKKLNESFTSKL